MSRSRLALALVAFSAVVTFAEPAEKVLVDQTFDLVESQDPGAPVVGKYSIRALEFADRIEITEVNAGENRGRMVEATSMVTYELRPEGPPTAVSGEATTSVGGVNAMKVSFTVAQRALKLKFELVGTKDGVRLPAPVQREIAVALPEGHAVTRSAVPVIGPRLLPNPGEMQILSLEFPDDITEPINAKPGYQLSRTAANAEGSYELKVTATDRREISRVPIGPDGKIKPYKLFGRFYMRERAPN